MRLVILKICVSFKSQCIFLLAIVPVISTNLSEKQRTISEDTVTSNMNVLYLLVMVDANATAWTVAFVLEGSVIAGDGIEPL